MNRLIQIKGWVIGISLFHLFTFSPLHAQKYVGGDISVLLKYEEQKATYFDKDVKEGTYNPVLRAQFINLVKESLETLTD